MEQVYCMQNAFSPIVFSEESDTGNRDYVEHSLVAFLGDPSKSLSQSPSWCCWRWRRRTTRAPSLTWRPLNAGQTEGQARNIREGTWRSEHMCLWGSAPSSRTADRVIFATAGHSFVCQRYKVDSIKWILKIDRNNNSSSYSGIAFWSESVI